MGRSILKSGIMQRFREESLQQRGTKTVQDQMEKHWERDIGGEEARYLGERWTDWMRLFQRGAEGYKFRQGKQGINLVQVDNGAEGGIDREMKEYRG